MIKFRYYREKNVHMYIRFLQNMDIVTYRSRNGLIDTTGKCSFLFILYTFLGSFLFIHNLHTSQLPISWQPRLLQNSVSQHCSHTGKSSRLERVLEWYPFRVLFPASSILLPDNLPQFWRGKNKSRVSIAPDISQRFCR